MAHDADDADRREPGLGLALLTVLGMIVTIGILSVLIWLLMIGVTATTQGRGQPGAVTQPSVPVIDQKGLPARP